jgi:hypothetical protein
MGALRRNSRGKRLGISLRADQVQRVRRVRAVREKLGVFADESFPPMHAPAAARLAHGHASPPPPEPIRDRTGDNGLANAGVGAGDEQAGDGKRAKHTRILCDQRMMNHPVLGYNADTNDPRRFPTIV